MTRMWPLLTNDRDLTPAELFDAYRWQPNLEKRHAQLKGTQLVAPMWLREPARILEIFTGVARHELTTPDGTALRTFHPELTDLQRQVLNLLDIPTSTYNPATYITPKHVREVRKASPWGGDGGVRCSAPSPA